MRIHIFLILSAILIGNKLIAQKLIINEIGFKLNPSQHEEITLLANYEAMLYNDLFSTTKNDTLVIPITIYKKAAYYKENAELLKAPKSSLGFWSGYTKQVYVYKHPEFIKTVVHEMGHSFMYNNMSNPPRWLNEGLSEFFESLEVVNNSVTVYKQDGRIRSIKSDLESFDLSKFLATNHSDWHGSKNDYMYNVSYSIVLFIMKTKPDNLKKLAQAYKIHKSSIKAVEAVYGSVKNMELYYKIFYRNY